MKEITADMVRQADQASYEMPIHPDLRYPASLYYRMLQSLMEQSQAEVAVELGTCGGGAALHLGLGNPQATVHTYDNNETMGKIWESVLFITDYAPNVEFIIGDSVEVAARYEPATVGLLFVDTTHTYEQTMKEWTAWIDKMKPGGVVILDDIRRPGMDQVLRELRAHPRVREILEFKAQGGEGLAAVLV